MTLLTDTELELFTDVELRSMLLAGELSKHGLPGFEFYLPVGRYPSIAERAASLVSLMRPGRTITGRSARWVHVGGPVPDRVELSRRSGRVLKIDEPIQCKFRRLKSSDIVTLAGIVLTTPARTALDLRRDGFATEAELLLPLLDLEPRRG